MADVLGQAQQSLLAMTQMLNQQVQPQASPPPPPMSPETVAHLRASAGLPPASPTGFPDQGQLSQLLAALMQQQGRG